MIRNIVKIALCGMFVLAASYNVYKSQSKVELSDLALENIEALASGESGTGYKYVFPGSDPSVKCVCGGKGDLSCC